MIRTKRLLINGGSFNKCSFKGDASFEGCKIDGDINFRGSVFEKSADISGVNCNGNANFDDVVFEGSALFSQTNFRYISFYASKFKKKLVFGVLRSNYHHRLPRLNLTKNWSSFTQDLELFVPVMTMMVIH